MVNQSFWLLIREYPGGILQFEKDFKSDFIARVQSRDKNPGRFDQLFENQPVYKDAYDFFVTEKYTIEDLDQIAYLPQAERINELSALQINPSDFDVWYEVLRSARTEGKVGLLTPTDLFKDVMWNVYINTKIS